MNHYLRNLYLVKSDPDLMQCCIQILDQHCKTLTEYNSCANQTHYLKPRMTQPKVLWISESPPNSDFITHIQPKHYRQILGKEFSLIIYDVAEGIRANPWYAVLGTLQLGGIMLLLSPTTDLASLPSALPMSYSESSFFVGSSASSVGSGVSYFNQLFADLFEELFPNHIVANAQQLRIYLDSWLEIQAQRLGKNLPLLVNQQLDMAIKEQATLGKLLVNDLLSKHEAKSQTNIHVLQADRGRGKSDLLGQLPSLLLQVNENECIFTQIIYVTQSNEATHTIRNGLYRFQDLLKGHLKGLENRTENIGPIQLRFCSPDDPILFALPNKNDNIHTLLLVDEAASLPVYWLQQAMSHYSSIVFATTTHGYENNGMGFSLSFLPSLDHYTTHRLTHPIRFIAPCPLENFAETLLSPQKATNALPTEINGQGRDGLHFLNHKQLMTTPSLRSAVMACLMEAHYQTAPDDLQRLLDAPDMECGIYMFDEMLIGCVWIVQEGNIDDQDLQQNIAQGSRRVNGHLSVQQLAYTYGNTALLKHNIWRINRIAVLPKYQDRGFGTKILSALAEQAKLAQVDMITSAFGASKRLLHFWQHNDYEIVKLGQKINSVTGLVNAIVLLPVSDKFDLQQIHDWHSIAQQWHCPIAIQSKQHVPIKAQTATDHANQMLTEFLAGTRSFDYAEMYIYWYIRNVTSISSINGVTKPSVNLPELLYDRYIAGHSLNTVMASHDLVNKKAVITKIKSLLVAML
jgi:tRNA(Met) cytidine acetyltransferase